MILSMTEGIYSRALVFYMLVQLTADKNVDSACTAQLYPNYMLELHPFA